MPLFSICLLLATHRRRLSRPRARTLGPRMRAEAGVGQGGRRGWGSPESRCSLVFGSAHHSYFGVPLSTWGRRFSG
eukprot:scaffold24863_cov112-Isochrysis_galbana.AAC.4